MIRLLSPHLLAVTWSSEAVDKVVADDVAKAEVEARVVVQVMVGELTLMVVLRHMT